MVQTWKMAWSAVCANKMRTFLTMLGIIIGVMALVVLVSIASGTSDSVSQQISDMGSSYLTVRINDDKENPLRMTEFSTLFNNEEIEAAAPFYQNSFTGKSGYTSNTMYVTGTTGDFFSIMNLELEEGRFLKKTDQENSSHVIILTYDTAVEYFGHGNAVGESVSLDGQSFQVVGVLASDNSTLTAGNISSAEDDSETVTMEGYIPYTAMTKLSDQALDITRFYVSSENKDSMDGAQRALEDIMLERFGYDEDAFSVQNQSEIMEAMTEVNNTMSLMLGGIAAISLLVGGIGIMNIMLVSVTERTREIGIRKAIGAGRGTILLQFLMEALLVSMLGCFVGIGMSWFTLQVIGKVMGGTIDVTMDMKTAGLSVVFSGIIGIIFGLYPANQAAAKKPIDALRYSG